MFKLGLTGGIGSGKSTCAQILRELGAGAVDADAISRAATQSGGAAMAAIAHEFGSNALLPDGSLNRAWMREQAFANPEVKKRLEAIIHPIVRQRIQDDVQSCTAAVCVLDIPLLVESRDWRSRVDAVWVVDCDETTQIERAHARSGLQSAQVQAVIEQQASRARRRAAADAVIHNDDLTLAELKREVSALYAELLQRL
jgi:dephospho-CoA kinase